MISKPTADELAEAYKESRLRYKGVSLMTALINPLIYKSLELQVQARRDAERLTESSSTKQAA